MKRMIVMSALLMSVITPVSFAQQSDSDALQAKLQQLTSLDGSFEQTVYDAQGVEITNAAGTLLLEQPRKIRWHQSAPDDTLFVSNGQNSYYYDPFAEQVTVLDTNNLIDNTPFILLTTDDQALWAKFTIEQEGEQFIVTPINKENAQVESLRLAFDEQVISRIEVVDQSGQRSVFSFKEPSFNQDIDDAKFDFTPPEGVFIDDQRQLESQ